MVLKGILAVIATATQYVFYKTFQCTKLINSNIKETCKKVASQTTGLHLLSKDQQPSYAANTLPSHTLHPQKACKRVGLRNSQNVTSSKDDMATSIMPCSSTLSTVKEQ